MGFKNLNKRINDNGKEMELITRPSSPGFWLCLLLPLAYLTSNIRKPYSSQTFDYRLTSLASYGICLQSINFFLYLMFGGGLIIRIILSFLPCFATAALFHIFLNQQPSICLFWAFLYCIFYQYVFIKVIRKLPKCFTFGEAAVVSQGFTLFIFNAVLQIPHFIMQPPVDDFNKMNAILMEGILSVIVFVWLISTFSVLQNKLLFSTLLFTLIAIIFFLPVTSISPINEILDFIFADSRRIFIIIFYAGMLGLSATAIIWQVSKGEKASTSIRKVFHILLVFVFIPGLLYQCTLLYISTGIALCGLIILELIRIGEIYSFHNLLKQSFNIFADEKDVGNVALTPFYLLVGCCLPLWISPSTCGIENNFIAPNSLLILLSGIITVGIGDTAASIFGSALGKHKLPYSEKTYEGLMANIVLQGLTVVQLISLNLIMFSNTQSILTFLIIIFVSLVEAYTDQVDNIVLPLVFYILANFI